MTTKWQPTAAEGKGREVSKGSKGDADNGQPHESPIDKVRRELEERKLIPKKKPTT